MSISQKDELKIIMNHYTTLPPEKIVSNFYNRPTMRFLWGSMMFYMSVARFMYRFDKKEDFIGMQFFGFLTC